MLSFTPGQKLENELRILQGDIVEIYKNIERLSTEEANYLHRFALISNIGASTRIENAVLTDPEIEWVDTILQKDGKTTAFEENKIYIMDKLKKDRERSVEEVVGCRQILSTVYVQAEELFPLSEVVIRGLHHDCSGTIHEQPILPADIKKFRTGSFLSITKPAKKGWSWIHLRRG